MRILFLGDIVGRQARSCVVDQIPHLKENLQCDFVITNCENSAGGFGVTPDICDALFDAGNDVLTSGNHIWDKSEISSYIVKQPRLLRPVNMNEGFPGAGFVIVSDKQGRRLAVLNVITNLFMADYLNVFSALDECLDKVKLVQDVDAIFVDVHGEATSEKMAIGHYLDGRVSCVVGTHTHVPTADHHILENGTAYQTDAGMCGDYDSVIGMNKKVATDRFHKHSSGRLSVATGAPTLCGVVVDIDDKTGLALNIKPLRRGGKLQETISFFE
tara:strand:- start:990 stop:1805 length:816 start_codon:yes stop_codon:yes gene_type:complete